MSNKKYREIVLMDGRYKQRTCRACDEPALYKSRYYRKDGRRGHAYHCQHHAEAFAKRYRILMPGDQKAIAIPFDPPQLINDVAAAPLFKKPFAPAPEQLSLLEATA